METNNIIELFDRVKISKTVYDIVSVDNSKAGYVYITIQKGNTQKLLSKNEKQDIWFLQLLSRLSIPNTVSVNFIPKKARIEKTTRGKTTTKSAEIKQALKAAFDGVKFSVTYKYPYGYKVKWHDETGRATYEKVQAIARRWDTTRNVGDEYDPLYIGDSVTCECKGVC